MISSRFFQRFTNFGFDREFNIALIFTMLSEFFSLCNIFTKMLKRGVMQQFFYCEKFRINCQI